MYEKLIATVAFMVSMLLISHVDPDQGVYSYADQPVAYGVLLVAVLAAVVALLCLASDRLSRLPEARKDFLKASGEATSNTPATLGWREKLPIAVLFCIGMALGVCFHAWSEYLGELSTFLVGGLFFGLGFHLWLGSTNRMLGVMPGSHFMPGGLKAIQLRIYELTFGFLIFMAPRVFGVSLEPHESVQVWPLTLSPAGFAVFYSWWVMDVLQTSVDMRVKELRSAHYRSGVGEPQAEPT